MSEQESAPVTKVKAINVTKDATIIVNVTENPKREGSASYDRFEGYLTDPAPETVQEALDNGLTMGDINYDFIHDTIDVDGATKETYTPVKREPKVEELEEAA
jgi:hypothetical protein